jgi:hypothetical protein
MQRGGREFCENVRYNAIKRFFCEKKDENALGKTID